jgi:PII-like signaling protein
VRILSLSEDVPMMIIIVDTRDKIRAFIVDPVEVIRYADRAYADERVSSVGT